MIFKLKRSVQINGSEISELNLDGLDELRGDDLTSLERGYKMMHKEMIPVIHLDTGYQMWVAGRAAGVNPEDLGRLYAPDYVRLGVTIQNFLLDVDLGEQKKV